MRDWEPVAFCRYVNALVVGLVVLQPSWIWNLVLRSCRASTAPTLSGSHGILSMESSTILKSPSIMSGFGRSVVCHFVRICFQNASFSADTFGAYMTRIFISQSACHVILSSIALPWTISVVFTFFVFVISLFSTIATPFELGSFGSDEWNIMMRLLNSLCS